MMMTRLVDPSTIMQMGELEGMPTVGQKIDTTLGTTRMENSHHLTERNYADMKEKNTWRGHRIVVPRIESAVEAEIGMAADTVALRDVAGITAIEADHLLPDMNAIAIVEA